MKIPLEVPPLRKVAGRGLGVVVEYLRTEDSNALPMGDIM